MQQIFDNCCFIIKTQLLPNRPYDRIHFNVRDIQEVKKFLEDNGYSFSIANSNRSSMWVWKQNNDKTPSTDGFDNLFVSEEFIFKDLFVEH